MIHEIQVSASVNKASGETQAYPFINVLSMSMEELSICYRDYLAHRAQNIYYLVLFRKS
jgi:hypothetical protein